MSKKTPNSLRSSLTSSPWGDEQSLVKIREGLVLRWYKDTLGKWTGGYGHLRKPGEESLVVTQALSDRWLAEDLTAAVKAAKSQFSQLPLQSQELYEVLVSVNFQLGIKWYVKFPKTWNLMLAGRYYEAADEAEDSAWFRQTPVRVRDLQRALRRTFDYSVEYKPYE